MKIKTKKQLNLPQLIEWAIDNNIKHRVFESNPNFDGVTYELGFDISGDLYFEEPLTPTLLFTVEVEEEITEDTVIPKLLVKANYDDTAKEYRNSKINEFVPKYTEAIYIVNDDLTMTLIWTKEKGLVE